MLDYMIFAVTVVIFLIFTVIYLYPVSMTPYIFFSPSNMFLIVYSLPRISFPR